MPPEEVLSALGWQADSWTLLSEKAERGVTSTFYRYQNESQTVTVTLTFLTPQPFLQELFGEESVSGDIRGWLDAKAEPEEGAFGDSDIPKVTWEIGGKAADHPNWESYAEAYTQARGGMMKPDGEAPLSVITLQQEERDGEYR